MAPALTASRPSFSNSSAFRSLRTESLEFFLTYEGFLVVVVVVVVVVVALVSWR